MYYGRKKGIIIAIIVVIFLIVLSIVGLFLFMKTDLFKSSKSLFWKYAGQTLDGIPTSFMQMEEIEKMKQQNPYEITGSLTASSSDSQMNSTLSNTQLNITEETDKTNKYSHINYKINTNNVQFLDLDYVNSQDVYALKSDEIVSAYIGIRNENLKVLAQKIFGNIDTSMIPDQIDMDSINYIDILKLSEDEIKHIEETYSQIFVNKIPSSNYSKHTKAALQINSKSYEATAYRLDLSAEEIKNLTIEVLNSLKTDSITLNIISTKAKMLGLDENYTTIDGIQSLIDDAINNANDMTYTDTSFVAYNYQGKTIATEIIVKNEQKITIYNSNNNLKFTVEDLKGESEYSNYSIDITYNITSTLTSASIILSTDDEQILEISLNNTGSAAQGNLQTEIAATIYNDEESYEFQYSQTLEFVDKLDNMLKLDNTNCAVLNDFTKEQITTLFEAIETQIQTVYAQKMESFTGNDATLNTSIQNTNIQNTNMQNTNMQNTNMQNTNMQNTNVQ